MSLKNESLSRLASSGVPASEQRLPRSLRVRLALWYGMLLTGAFISFAALVWGLTTTVLNQSVSDAVHAEARGASLQVDRELLSVPPYWPMQFVLQGLNTYQEPGVVVEVRDAQGYTRYDSDGNSTTHIPVSADDRRALLAGQSVVYQSSVQSERVQVEGVPIHAQDASSTADTPQTPTTTRTPPGPVIGMLLVAKSLGDVRATLSLVQTLLLLVGGGTLLSALLGGWVIAARVLSPLSEMAKTARAIAATTARGTRIGNLSQRVRRQNGRDEMTQVVDAFNEMLTNLERATTAQRRFVADASHELRAPLTTIQGNLAFLRRHADELPAEERHTMLSDAHAETLRLAQLVEELLLLARADASVQASTTLPEKSMDREADERHPVELDHVILQLVRQLRGRLNVEDGGLKLDVGPIEPVRVRGDEEGIRRILLILLDNALKYTPTPEKDRAGRVTVSLERTETEALVRVRDTGIGIEPADLPHIFERFYRADRARSRQGTGLGLSIAQTLVEQLGGRLIAQSTPGQGSTFTLWLPLASRMENPSQS